MGTGVQIANITRDVNQALEQAVVKNTSASSNSATQLDGLNQLQTYLATGTGSLHDAIGNLFTQMETLTTEPTNSTQRQIVVAAARDVTDQLNQTVTNLNEMSSALLAQAKTQVGSINNLSAQIASLNQQIHQGTLSGANINGLLDQRDQALSGLAKLVDVNTVAQSNNQISVFAGGSPLVLDNQAATLSLADDSHGQILINSSEATQPIDVSGGQLGGVITLHNTTLPAVQTQLDTFTQALASQFDQLQATGFGLNGPFTSLSSLRPVTNTNQPLATQNLAFPPQSGSLYITVTNTATGQRTLNKVTIDPKTQSLAGVAAAISTIPNMQAVVDPQAGTLNLLARPGFAFDFSGGVSTSPDTQTITGSTAATIAGHYTGNADDALSYSFSGPGTIGVTPNLMMNVHNAAGTLLSSINVGQGYAPGTASAAVNGVSVQLAAGTVAASDSFTVNVAAHADSANLLTGLGLNTFFVGGTAGDLRVNPNLLGNPQLLATSGTGQAGDSSNLAKMVALQTQPVLANGSLSLPQFLEGLIGSVGTQTANMKTNSAAFDALGQQLNNQLQSAVGVDPNAALMQLVQYQQSYQMSAQFVSVVNQTVQALLHII